MYSCTITYDGYIIRWYITKRWAYVNETGYSISSRYLFTTKPEPIPLHMNAMINKKPSNIYTVYTCTIPYHGLVIKWPVIKRYTLVK